MYTYNEEAEEWPGKTLVMGTLGSSIFSLKVGTQRLLSKTKGWMGWFHLISSTENPTVFVRLRVLSSVFM